MKRELNENRGLPPIAFVKYLGWQSKKMYEVGCLNNSIYIVLSELLRGVDG